MFYVYDKRDTIKENMKVYSVQYKHGYPFFTLYKNDQWITESAKYYVPIELKDIERKKERDIIDKFCNSIKEKYSDIKFKVEYNIWENFWDIWHSYKDYLDDDFRRFTGEQIIKYFGDNDIFNTGFAYGYHIFENK
ncbi:hypothetical protein ACFHWD_03495 [Clostridium sp. MT-14]|uniref:hypothetical protein n=1 Tax=Clostridium sp. MT-14 TaxID=3348360 RepID=UPI0035F407D5